MKPHIGSEVTYVSSYLPVRSEMMWSVYEIISYVEALIFFRLLLSSCLSWKIYCEDHLFRLQPQYTYDIISVEILLAASCYSNRDKLQQHEPVLASLKIKIINPQVSRTL